jgi:hypothetical protein
MLGVYRSFLLPIFLMITSSLMNVISDVALSKDALIIFIKNNDYII